ncbi:MAG: hypothetical protein AAFQ92_27920, partial [Bacteroidota bacterium]
FGRSTTVREVLEVYGLADLAELLPGKSVDALLAWKEERVVKGRIGKEKNGAVVINSDYEDDDDDGEKGDSDAVVTMVDGVPTAAAGGQSGNKKSGLGPMAASVVGGLGLDSKHESAVAQLALNNPEFKEELVAAATEATAVTQPAPSQATSPIISTEAPPAAALTTSGPPVDFVDTAWQDTMKLLGCNDRFESEEHLDFFLERYLKKTSISLRKKNDRTKNLLYCECVTHSNCPFYVRFRTGKEDDSLEMYAHRYHHKGVTRPDVDRAGRAHKRRWKYSMDASLTNLNLSVSQRLIAQDVLKSEENHKKREDVPKHAAYRCLRQFVDMDAEEEILTYQLIIPYIRSFRTLNKKGVAEYSLTANGKSVRRVFFCPPSSNEAIRWMPPVISLDACHTKDGCSSMIYAFTCLTGAGKIYTLAFGMAEGNECTDDWTWMMTHFKTAMPALDEPTLQQSEIPTAIDFRENPAPVLKYRDVVFISDRDKGLLKSLRDIFPNHLSTYCLMHIQRNVAHNFNKPQAVLVDKIARTFNINKESYLLGKLKRMNRSAYNYVMKIDPECFRSTMWTRQHFGDRLDPSDTDNPIFKEVKKPDEYLPRRYGIFTSNTSESIFIT